MENENSVSSEKCVCILYIYVLCMFLTKGSPPPTHIRAMVNDLLLSSPFHQPLFIFIYFSFRPFLVLARHRRLPAIVLGGFFFFLIFFFFFFFF